MTDNTDTTARLSVVRGPEGAALYINDRRVAGAKPWGGGSVLAEMSGRPIDIAEGLVGQVQLGQIDTDSNDAAAWHLERETKMASALADKLREMIIADAKRRWQS